MTAAVPTDPTAQALALNTPNSPHHIPNPIQENPFPNLAQAGVEQLAEQIAQDLTIKSQDWHRLKSNRRARALEQTAVALVYLLKDQPEEALVRLQQATGWLDRTLNAPPCPTHGHRRDGE